MNSRLITNAEEVAFYQGNNRERLTLLASFNKLTSHIRKFLEFRVGMGIIDNMVAKCKFSYFTFNIFKMFQSQLIIFTDIATIVGFWAVSRPFFVKDHPVLSSKVEGERLKVRTFHPYFS